MSTHNIYFHGEIKKKKKKKKTLQNFSIHKKCYV